MNSDKKLSIYLNSNWVRQLCSTADVHCNSVEDVVQYLKSGRVKKVIVMTGAGISTVEFQTSGLIHIHIHRRVSVILFTGGKESV